MKKGGESGPVIVPGKPAESYLLERLVKGEMPPGEKRVSDAEIAVLRRWIAAGALTARPEPESIGNGLGITPEDRQFWSFQPIRRTEAPLYPVHDRVRTPIDAQLRVAMPEGLRFSRDADRFTLIKRAYFDLIGLPPSPDQVKRWLEEKGDWYERLVDELLDSPHYGERWARHWLDIVGYADSEGYTVSDAQRPWAWKYRDYLIRAFNQDKPFDRLIIEQLAGDELAGPRQRDWSAQQIEWLTATGFLRMAADGTGSGAKDPQDRNQVMIDTIRIVSTSLLGMSVACAQCHDHRYDPILQTDYYALRAIFEPALDYQQWQTPAERRISLYTEAERELLDEIETEVQTLELAKHKKRLELVDKALEIWLEKLDEALREPLRHAFKTPLDKRTGSQNALLNLHPSVKNLRPDTLPLYIPIPELGEIDKQIAATRAKIPPQAFLRALIEPADHTPETRLFHRGDHKQPKQIVTPASLTVVTPQGERREFPLKDESLPSSGRRLAFAKWLTSGQHPLVPRVLVNRIWMHHFGRGLVATPADFGKLGVEPTHPQLLDWLADEFVRQGWSLKKLHRLILTSTAWRQSSILDPQMEAIDPTNRYYWRKSVVRLEAEAIRDRMLATTDSLDPTLFGPPLKVKEDDTGQVTVTGAQNRRSIYIQVRRTQPVAMLQAFDAPVMETNCESRLVSTVATQSLMLMNGPFILDQARMLADHSAHTAESRSFAAQVSLGKLPDPPTPVWQFGYGRFDDAAARTGSFTVLAYWTGKKWQGGTKLPDPKLGNLVLTAKGGHPGKEFATIRRWTAYREGVLTVSGTFEHALEKGNGVGGRVVSSRSGVAGEWTAHNDKVETKPPEIEVQPGDTIDFITDCLDEESSDSFTWQVTLTLKQNGETIEDNSVFGFHGPDEPYERLPDQIIRAWELAYGRMPSADELRLAVKFVARQLEYLHENPQQLPKDVRPSQFAMTNLCQSLLGSNEFLYVD